MCGTAGGRRPLPWMRGPPAALSLAIPCVCVPSPVRDVFRVLSMADGMYTCTVSSEFRDPAVSCWNSYSTFS